MLRIALSCLFILILLSSGKAQQVYRSSGFQKTTTYNQNKKGFDRDKLVFGGDFRFAVGVGATNLGLAPIIGYQVLKNFYTGVRLGYNYSGGTVFARDTTTFPDGKREAKIRSNDYSLGLWARYLILQSYFIHLEAEMISYNVYDGTWDFNRNRLTRIRTSAPSVMVGVGFKQAINDRASFNTTILYDVLGDFNSYYAPYNGFDIRFGILFGF